MPELINVFSMLSDATRLGLLFALAQEEKNVTTLCEEFRLGQPTASHHLGLLRMAGLVTTRRNGKRIFYSLAPSVSASKAKGKAALEFAIGDGATVRVTRPA